MKCLQCRLVHHPLKCDLGGFQFQGFIREFEQKKDPEYRKNGLLPNGYLKYRHQFYTPDEYCING